MQSYFGLNKIPFGKDIKPFDLIQTYDLREAMARLNHIKQHRGIMALTGEPGSGKTTLLRKWVDELNPQSFLHCYTPHTTVSRADMYRQINSLLNLPLKSKKSDLFRQIQNSILHNYQQGKITCLIFDECQLMDHATLQELVLITNFEMDSKLPFIVVLVGQPEFKDILTRAIHEPLRQRIQIRYHLTGLSIEECKTFVEDHLKLVGRKDPLFEVSCYSTIHQLTSGLPRNIGKLAINAMQMAMIQQTQLITTDMLIKVAAEL
jgi:type II secretory pathway predicted ATPase ExeA